MFGQYFNIDESAFSIAPNPKYLYLSKQHEEALAHLVYGVTRKSGFVCLTGDIGTGKTTICRCMFEQLPENTDIAFVINPKFSPMELLAAVCDELKLGSLTFQPSIKEYVKKLNTYLIEAHARGRNTVLVIDEAQNLSIDALEHVRALTNLETNDQKLLQIILIGQPELKTLLARPELEQVNQRITARFHIGPLSLNETNHYINHRLLVAGAKQKIFSTDNIKQIHKYTKGVPRRINILCDRILLGAYTIRKNKITPQIITQSAKEVFDVRPAFEYRVPKAFAASVLALLVSGAMVFAYQNSKIDSGLIENGSSEDELASLPNTSKVLADKKEVTAPKERISDEFKSEQASQKQVSNVKVSQEKIKQEQIKQEQIKQEQIKVVATKQKNLDKNQVKAQEKIQINEQKANYLAKAKDNLLPKESNKVANNTKPEVKLAYKQDLQLTSYGKAYQKLFRLWGISFKSTDNTPCEHAERNKLQCYKGWGDIKELISLNRPVLLRSKSQDLGPNYIVVVSIEGDYAVVNEKGDYQVVAISEVESNWNGEFEMLWRPMKLGVTHISPGQRGQAVALLDKKLAKIQGREPAAQHPFVYSKDLVDQVRAFQLANKLPSDGVVGPVTQMHFNNNETQASDLNTPVLIK